MKKLLIALAGAACLLSSVSAAQADQLQDIEKRGVIRIAVPQDFPPFGSVGTDLQPQGYDIDMARYLAKSMKLKLQLVPVTSANRVPYLQTDKVDTVISSLGKNAEREKVIDFSRAYAVLPRRVWPERGGTEGRGRAERQKHRCDPRGGGRYGTDQRGAAGSAD